VRSFSVDVSNFDDVERLKSSVYEAFGDVALLMNNAGIGGHRRPAAQVANLRLASVNKWRLEDKREALVRMHIVFARIVATTPHPP